MTQLSKDLVGCPRHDACAVQVLHMIMGLERLDRITAFAEEDMELAPPSVFASNALQASRAHHMTAPLHASA